MLVTLAILNALVVTHGALTCSDVQAIFQGNGDSSLSCCGSSDPYTQAANVPSCDAALGLAYPLAQAHLNGYTFHTDALPYAPDSLDTAYKAQQRSQKIVREILGQTPCGLKAGLTATATQQTFGVNAALFGNIACERILASPATLTQSEFVAAPRFEAEISYILGQPVHASTVPFTSETVKPFLANVTGSFEIIDFRAFGGASTAISFVTGNIFYKNTVLGNPVPWTEEVQSKLDGLNVTVKEDGVILTTGSASAVEPSLLEVVAQAFNHAVEYGHILKKGDIIMTGSFVGVNVIQPDTNITLDFGEFGTLSLTMTS